MIQVDGRAGRSCGDPAFGRFAFVPMVVVSGSGGGGVSKQKGATFFKSRVLGRSFE